jgi:hypothetical protein
MIEEPDGSAVVAVNWGAPGQEIWEQGHEAVLAAAEGALVLADHDRVELPAGSAIAASSAADSGRRAHGSTRL